MPETMKIWTNVPPSAIFSLSATEVGTNNQYQILTRIIHGDQEIDRWSTEDLFSGQARLTLSGEGGWLVVVRPTFISSTTSLRVRAEINVFPDDVYEEVIDRGGLTLNFSMLMKAVEA